MCCSCRLGYAQPVDESVRLETSPIRTGTGRGTASLSGSVPDYGDTREIPGEPDRTERLKPRAPSKLEQRIMADALQRQRDGITKTQVLPNESMRGGSVQSALFEISIRTYSIILSYTSQQYGFLISLWPAGGAGSRVQG